MSELATTTATGSELAHVLSPTQIIQQLAEVAGPEGLSQGLLETLKVPSGSSASAWNVMDIEQGEISKKEVFGVILGVRYIRAMWLEKIGTRAAMRPDCKSANSLVGEGNPGGNCLTCPLSQYGSAIGNDGKPSNGQACKQMIEIWMIRPDMLIPSILRVPPTSIKNAKQYFMALTGKGIPPHNAMTAFTLTKDKNAAGMDYQKVVFRFVGRLEKEQVAGFEALRQYVMGAIGHQTIDLTSDDYSEVETPLVNIDPAAAQAASNGETKKTTAKGK